MARGYKPSEEIITTGERKGLIVIRDGRVTYKATEKSYDFGDPEEPVRTNPFGKLLRAEANLDVVPITHSLTKH